MITPEARSRIEIDRLPTAAGWHVYDCRQAKLHAARGVAIRGLPLEAGHGDADYLLYVDSKAAGVIEAKKRGATLTDVEIQPARCAEGLPAAWSAWLRPLPFSYESTSLESHFTNGLDTAPWARSVFARGRPKTLAGCLQGLMPAVPHAEAPEGWAASFHYSPRTATSPRLSSASSPRNGT